MPMPVVEPMPLPGAAERFGAPLLAQDASYFAASARMANFRSISTGLALYTASRETLERKRRRALAASKSIPLGDDEAQLARNARRARRGRIARHERDGDFDRSALQILGRDRRAGLAHVVALPVVRDRPIVIGRGGGRELQHQGV